MSTKILFTVILPLFLFGACHTERKQTSTDFLEIDVTKNYPVKELFLDDLAEISYCVPALSDEYLYTGIPQYITEEYMFMFEYSSGDILVFDKNGIPSHKFNRKGEGPNEYNMVFGLIYDPHVKELYVQTIGRIQVYSLTGDYIRTLAIQGEGRFISDVVIFDDGAFLCYDNYEYFPVPFFLISRVNGQLIEEIDIQYENKLKMNARRVADDGMIYTYSPTQTHIVHTERGFLLTDHSVDSVYLYTPDKQLIPVLVRTPAIASMHPYTFLNSYLESPSYLFMTTISTEFDWDTKKGFSESHLVLDKSDGKLYEQKIYLKEYQGKEISLTPAMQSRVSGNINGLISFGTAELQEALEEGKLSGRLKEIASQMEEDSNRLLLLLLRFK